MKKFFFFISIVLFSCTGPNVAFVDPQPIFLESIEEIPVDYQGEFIEIGDEAEELIVVTPTNITLNVDGEVRTYDSLIVKSNGNYLYVNVLNEQGYYELYVARLVRCLEYENIKVMAGAMGEEDLNFFNIIDKYTIPSSKSGFGDKSIHVLDDLTVNQLNQYINVGYNGSDIFAPYAEYKRNK
jgi:hypothetical protein